MLKIILKKSLLTKGYMRRNMTCSSQLNIYDLIVKASFKVKLCKNLKNKK